MSFESLVSGVYQAFQKHAADARVILLHARSRYRTALISRLLSDPQIRVFYYALGAEDVDVESFIAGFTHDLAEQVPTFGAHVNQVGLGDLKDLTPLLNAFVKDLNELSDEPYLLLLDEFDRADIADDLQTFLEALVGVLPPQCRLVINSRQLPRLPWMSSLLTTCSTPSIRSVNVTAKRSCSSLATLPISQATPSSYLTPTR